MTDRSLSHHTIVLERQVNAVPARVFAAWRDPKALRRWYMPGDGWESSIAAIDFRVGGGKRFNFGPPGDLHLREECRYEDIVPGERIIYTMIISDRDVRITASLVTVEIAPSGDGTRLVVTDQLTVLDGGDSSRDRRQGWSEGLDKLAALMATGDDEAGLAG